MMTCKYKQQSTTNPWTTQVWNMSVYTWIFFNKCTQRNAIHGWLNPWMQNCGYGCTTSGLEHPRILVSTVGPGTNPLWLLREDCSLEGKAQSELFIFFMVLHFWRICDVLNEGITLFHGGQNWGTLEMMMGLEVEIRARFLWVPRWALGLSQWPHWGTSGPIVLCCLD